MSSKSALPAPEKAPAPHWEKHILYAYLRMMGSTQVSAGSAVGRSRRTVQNWEEDKALYARAREEARQRWLTDLADASRNALLNTIKSGHGVLALQVLERLDEDLAPAKQRLDVGVEGGGISALLVAARENGHLPVHTQEEIEEKST